MTSIVIDVGSPRVKRLMELMGCEEEIFKLNPALEPALSVFKAHCCGREELSNEAERLLDLGDHEEVNAVVDHLRWCGDCTEVLEDTLNTIPRGSIIIKLRKRERAKCDPGRIHAVVRGNNPSNEDRAHLWHCARCRREAIDYFLDHA